MLIVAGEFRMQPGSRSDFFEAVAPMVEATLNEPGCHAYSFTADPNDDDVIRLWELWDDDEALAGHFHSGHMAEWRQRSANLPIVSRDLTKYTVTDATPLA